MYEKAYDDVNRLATYDRGDLNANNGVKKSTGDENIAKIAKSCEAVCAKYNEDR